ncbi:MAG: chromate transporter [Spirochaetia bacterium]|jgi:chromate transporter|nr:chromate transporter [Spirochaetia bacterium]
MEEKKISGKEYLTLFRTMFTLSAFTFGGGYVIVSLMKQEFVDRLGWIDDDEMLNLVAIAQSSPGAVAVNGAMLVGEKVGGPLGAAVSILATILPPFIILSIISMFYAQFRSNRFVNAFLTGMQPAIAAVIADVVVDLGGKIIKQKKLVFILVMILAFFANYQLKLNIILILAICALVGGIMAVIGKKKEERGAAD